MTQPRSKARRPMLPFLVVVPLFHRLILAMFISLILSPLCASADQVDDLFVSILRVINSAEDAAKAGKSDVAKEGYTKAQASLVKLKQDYPAWNAKVVSRRLSEVAAKLAEFSKPPTEPEPAASTQETQPAAPKIRHSALPPVVQIKLLDPGTEPREALVFKLKSGARQTAVVTAKSRVGMGEPGSVDMIKMPSINVNLAAQNKSVSGAGDASYEIRIDGINVVEEQGAPPEVVESVKTSMQGLKGMTMQGVMTDRGFVKKLDARIPPGMSAEARESVEEMRKSFAETDFVLPEEPVGVGARWEVRQKVKSEGITVDETAVHEIVSIGGDVITVVSTNIQTAANQKIPNPMTGQGTVDVIKLNTTETSRSTLDLTRLLPLRIISQERSEQILEMEVEGQKKTVTMKSETDVSLEAK